MMHVALAKEPDDFEEKVRQPGRRALAEMVGEVDLPKRPGRPRKKIAEVYSDIPSSQFPEIWREAIPDLMHSYQRVCSYTCFYIERVTGAGSVDHMLPKSRSWQQAYEWSNYRLACSLMNSRKNDYMDVLDPMAVGDDWFQLELVGFQVIARPDLDAPTKMKVEATISRLKLNDYDCRTRREEYANAYELGEIKLEYLRKRAPLLAREIERISTNQINDIQEDRLVGCPICFGNGKCLSRGCPACSGEGHISVADAGRLDRSQYELVNCPCTFVVDHTKCDACNGTKAIFRKFANNASW